ncbi:MAG: sugar-binding transcriptional regulator [candidate division NC10 bacterium]|nr:sugar-binding transcriptional regulator [candidate division NC10 bacterium]
MDERVGHLLVSVANLYYLQHRTQAQIAERLRISRPHISRLLKRARQEGVVTISIRSPFEHAPALSEELAGLFPLRDVVVVPSGEDTVSRVAEAAAAYLSSRLRRDAVLGVSWGRTVRLVVDSLTRESHRHIEVVPLVGGMGSVGDEIHANEIARRAAMRVGGRYYVLNAPALAETSRAQATLVRDPAVRDILGRARRAEVALVGIGGIVPGSTLVKSGYLKSDDLRGLKAAGAVGDICSRYFCLDGSRCPSSLDTRVVGIELQDLRRVPWTVAVAAGGEKAAAILGALRGGYINVLITDEATARLVLRLAQGGAPRPRSVRPVTGPRAGLLA